MSVIRSGPRKLGYVEGFKEARDQILALIKEEMHSPFIEWYEEVRLERLQKDILKLKV